jgi:hypothetical protein
MFKKKTKQELAFVATNPIRTKLEDALQKITEQITELKDGKHSSASSAFHDWEWKIYEADALLAHPQCTSKTQAQALRDIAIEQFMIANREQALAEAQLEEMEEYKSTISEALLKLGPIASTDELQLRIEALGSLKALNVSPADKTDPATKHAVYDEIKPTLFAVDALISLQKEGIES